MISIKATTTIIGVVTLEPLLNGRDVWRGPFGEMAWVGATLGFDWLPGFVVTRQ